MAPAARHVVPRPRPSSSMAEQRTFNPLVQGSSPWGVTNNLWRISAKTRGRREQYRRPRARFYPRLYPKTLKLPRFDGGEHGIERPCRLMFEGW